MKYYREKSYYPEIMHMEIELENGVSLVFDCHTEKATGSDGKIYYPVCRVIDDGSAGGDLETLGWSCEVDGEVILEE